MALMKLMILEPLRPVEELISRIAELEARFSGIAPPVRTEQHETAGVQKQIIQNRPQPSAAFPEKALNQPKEWLEIIRVVKSAFPALASRLEHGRFVAFENSSLEVAFDPRSSHLEYMQESANSKRLEDILSNHYGKPIRFDIVESTPGNRVVKSAAEEKSRIETESRQRARDEAIAHPIIQEAVKVFGGKIIQTDKK